MLMPSLFISHGSPTVMIEQESPAHHFLKGLAGTLPRPKSILVISAHWETEDATVNRVSQNETIHDFYGFPKEMYQLSYNAPGDTELADQVSSLIGAEIDEKRGLDHGAWSPLILAYPETDIPVVQLSLQSEQPPLYHYDIGKRLKSLRNQGVLIIGSGALTHNFAELKENDTTPSPWALDYENWFVDAIERNHHDEILNADLNAPDYMRAHPRDEHWLPLYVAMGAADQSAQILHRGFEYKNLSMASVRFD